MALYPGHYTTSPYVDEPEPTTYAIEVRCDVCGRVYDLLSARDPYFDGWRFNYLGYKCVCKNCYKKAEDSSSVIDPFYDLGYERRKI